MLFRSWLNWLREAPALWRQKRKTKQKQRTEIGRPCYSTGGTKSAPAFGRSRALAQSDPSMIEYHSTRRGPWSIGRKLGRDRNIKLIGMRHGRPTLSREQKSTSYRTHHNLRTLSGYPRQPPSLFPPWGISQLLVLRLRCTRTAGSKSARISPKSTKI